MNRENVKKQIKMMSIKELGSMGLISEYRIRKLVKEEKVPYFRAGKKVLINYYDLEDMLLNLKRVE